MMKKRKILAIGLLLVMLLQCLIGCSDAARFKATLYSDADEWMDKAFLNENPVNGAFYRNPEYTEEKRYEGVSKWVRVEGSPSSRTFIITTQEEFASYFPSAELEIDFEKEMVILHIFTDCVLRGFDIEEMELVDGVLTVRVERESKHSKILDSVHPYPRCFLLKMKKAEIAKVVFEGN